MTFQILSCSSFIYHPFIQCYIVLVTEKALLTKLQTNINPIRISNFIWNILMFDDCLTKYMEKKFLPLGSMNNFATIFFIFNK
jgi:hypothetical protein